MTPRREAFSQSLVRVAFSFALTGSLAFFQMRSLHAEDTAAPSQTMPSPAPQGAPAANAPLSPAPEPEPTQPAPIDYKKFRDPFQEQAGAATTVEKKSDLENYGTTEFRLTGVMTGPIRMRAILVAPNGKSFIVNEGARIGNRDGYIKKITTKSILVEEKQVNEIGEIEKFDQEITLETDLESKR